jgi:hypothetical protein
VISCGEFTRIEENLFGFMEINDHSKICRGWAFEIYSFLILLFWLGRLGAYYSIPKLSVPG